jgi:hypothetical protein
MFGRQDRPPRRQAQKIRLRDALLYAGLFMGPMILPSQAQTSRETVDQTTRNRSQPGGTYHEYTPEPSLWKRLTENMHGGYSVTLMGPRPIGNSNETYNIFVPDVAPIQLYHSTSIYFQVSPDLTFGFGVDAVQNLANNVVGNTGIIRGSNFTLYDPTLNFTFPNLIQVPGWTVFTSASMSLVLTEASMNIGRVTSINLNQNWRVFNYPSDWSYGFDVNINPQFYTEPFPAGFSFRKTFYMSMGHFLSYRISPQVSITNTTTFDFDHRTPTETGVFAFSPALDDRMRFSLWVNPNVFPMFLSFGGYFQFLIWNPRVDTSIFGLDFSVGF